MTEDVEEPVLAAGLPHLSGHRTPAGGPSAAINGRTSMHL